MRRTLLLGLSLACLRTLPAAGQQDSAKVIPKDEKGSIAARVNEEIITWDDVNAQFKDKKVKPSPELLKGQLRQMAEERLFQQEAKRLKITVSEEDIDAQVKSVIKTLGDEDKYEEWLRWSRLTKSEHREQLKYDVLVIKLYRYLIQQSIRNGSDAPLLVEFISPEEIRNYYEANKNIYKSVREASVARIALNFTSQDKEFKKRLGESLLRKLDAGSDFYLIACFYSDVRPTDSKGQKTFSQAIKPDNEFYSAETTKYLFEVLEVGKHSPLIEDGKTLNIFLLERRIDKKEETFEEAQVKIRTELEHRKREENRKTLRDVILKRAYVWPPDLFKRD